VSKRDPDAFRVTGPSYQRWTGPRGCEKETWLDALNGIMGVNNIDPNEVDGFRIQVNFKRRPSPAKEQTP
jgi:hypothetical protein